MIELYIFAYRQMPETQEEVEAACRLAGTVLVDEPWQ
jgi:hypothetical protein